MAIETEAKFRVSSHEPVRQRLLSLGATLLDRVVETNLILDRPDGSLRNRGCGLRIRSARSVDGGEVTATMTFKGPVISGPVKSREELEVQVSDAESAAALLERLGFVTILCYEKLRESWRLDECRIELDEPPHIGLFVEIEGPDVKAIRTARNALGLEAIPHTQASYVRMLTTYCNEHGLTDRRVLLP